MTGLKKHADKLVDKCWPSWLLIAEQVPNLPFAVLNKIPWYLRIIGS